MKEKYYIKEFELFDGETFITFDIVAIDNNNAKITVAITNCGKITVTDYDLLQDEEGYYFEYGRDYQKIALKDFEEVSTDETDTD